MNLNTCATLAAFRDRLGLASADTDDDPRLLARLRAATAQIERYTGRTFTPTIATRRFDWHNSNTLLFRGYDLLELTALVNGDGSTIASNAITTFGGIGGPLVGVGLDPALATFVYGTTKRRALAVTGVWGWHDDYTNAWKPSGDVVPVGGLTSSATTFTVVSITAADGWGLAPRFSAGQLLKIDAEYLHVVGADSNTNQLTVVRGANGSTAASHTASTAISVYSPPVDIQEITLRWAAWLYKMEDAGDFNTGNAASFVAGGDGGITAPVMAPPAIPADLLGVLRNLRTVGSAVGGAL